MIKSLAYLVLAAVVSLTSGCASGPKFTEMSSTFPTLEAGNGRIWFYRPSKFIGAAIQPGVNLNGEKVGVSKPGGFFFVDRAPGDYEVIMSTEVDKKLSFQLDAGEEKYVRMAVGLGVIVYRVFPELADSSKASAELQKLSFIENPIE